MSTIDFSSLPQELLLDIARNCLLPRTNRYEIREYPHTNQVDFDLLAVDFRGRAALLEILRRGILYIEVTHHDCNHRVNIDPRTLTAGDRARLGEGTHPSLDDVFGQPGSHPALRLKQAGHLVHTVQINIRCIHLCQNARPRTLAFLPAQAKHILALCPILQRIQKAATGALDVGFVEMITSGIDRSYPQIKQQTHEAIDLVQNILPGVCHGTMTQVSILNASRVLADFYGARIDAQGWPVVEPFIQRYLVELEACIADGTPIHELAGLAENFLVNKLFPNFGSHGQNMGIDNETFVSIFNIFNKFQCIFMDGMAEYLLRREATADGQSHHVLDAICNETHFMWCHFNRAMATTMEWARNITCTWNVPAGFPDPTEANLSLFVQCGAVRLAETRLRFAMARARRVQPSLHHYQNLCTVSRMATPNNVWAASYLITQQASNARIATNTLLRQIKAVRHVFGVETPELVTLWARCEELITLIDMETGRNPYAFTDWLNTTGIDRRPVLTLPPAKYELVELQPTAEVLQLIAEHRRQDMLGVLVIP